MDLSTLAKSIVDQATEQKEIKRPSVKASARDLARKDALTPERRSEIAQKAAGARWDGREKAEG